MGMKIRNLMEISLRFRYLKLKCRGCPPSIGPAQRIKELQIYLVGT